MPAPDLRFEPDHEFNDPGTLVLTGPCPPAELIGVETDRRVKLGRIYYRDDLERFEGVIDGMDGCSRSADQDVVKAAMIEAVMAAFYPADEMRRAA